ncbi:MAG TPA: DUF427 domain-containing protein [Pseudonocardiaceae bacterium]|jgi:uncharacterized protein (DUF427 family)|nr:DUF427 domain-containing protein [Pseudonocardiaceae bacterium]
MTYQAVWNGAVLAETDDVVTVEGNLYFPATTLKPEYISDSSMTSVCPWKGTASYFSVTVNGAENKDSVWYYPTPKPEAEQIRGRVAFWRGVEVKQVN